jgi:Histidine kinase-, DNA gyrase B-, and HSP90-like ATPase
MATRVRRKRAGAITGNLRPADPFELIRWLARSQNDPRKALAELVQNSLDAGARRVQIVRARERGTTTLHVLDDGEGVLPEVTREEALGYIATHIGHSRKRNLTPEQRRELMLQGKYGIGLLGFWSIGTDFEMRSQVNDSEPCVLRLTEDQPKFSIERLRGRLPLQGTWTEVVVRQLHRPAFVSLGARRIADYLAAELRGQLLARPVVLTVHDRVARGRAPKLLHVQPVRYPGQPLALPEVIDTARGPLRVELYLLPEGAAEPGRVTVSCAGTVVYDDLCEFELVDFRRPPWSSGRVTGMVDFAAFEVAPGTRRGVQPDAAAVAFAEAVQQLEEPIQAMLAHEQERLASQLEADLLKQLQRAFRDLPHLAPEYDFFAVRDEAVREPDAASAPAGAVAGAAAEAAPLGVAEPAPGETAPGEVGEPEEAVELFPPGPLATVEILPPMARVSVLGSRGLRAHARAADGREIREPMAFTWACSSEHSRVDGRDRQATFYAGEELETVTVWVVATQGDRHTSAEAAIEVVEERPERAPQAGIPQPEFINEATGNWRSRFQDGRWQVNAGHRDYLIASESSRRKLRYLTALLAKEIVLHSFPHPQHATVLERMVEVLTITDRRLER